MRARQSRFNGASGIKRWGRDVGGDHLQGLGIRFNGASGIKRWGRYSPHVVRVEDLSASMGPAVLSAGDHSLGRSRPVQSARASMGPAVLSAGDSNLPA